VVGAAITTHPDLAGVAFTGGTETAWAINRTLAARPGPIVPFIAETGGLNGMFVDTTALREQVIDDVILFGLRLGWPALLGVAAAVPAEGHCRPHHRRVKGAMDAPPSAILPYSPPTSGR